MTSEWQWFAPPGSSMINLLALYDQAQGGVGEPAVLGKRGQAPWTSLPASSSVGG